MERLSSATAGQQIERGIIAPRLCNNEASRLVAATILERPACCLVAVKECSLCYQNGNTYIYIRIKL